MFPAGHPGQEEAEPGAAARARLARAGYRDVPAALQEGRITGDPPMEAEVHPGPEPGVWRMNACACGPEPAKRNGAGR